MKNYYMILNLDETATDDNIYASYRNKIAIFNKLPFLTEKMIIDIKNLKEALYVLGDINKRKQYNKIYKYIYHKFQESNDEMTHKKSLDSMKICDRLFSIKFA